jgi:hypothetical protein
VIDCVELNGTGPYHLRKGKITGSDLLVASNVRSTRLQCVV